jgi:hypothetical protein
LFAESLTQEKKLDAKELERLGLPYAVPVAVLFYLLTVSLPKCVFNTQPGKFIKSKILQRINLYIVVCAIYKLP